MTYKARVSKIDPWYLITMFIKYIIITILPKCIITLYMKKKILMLKKLFTYFTFLYIHFQKVHGLRMFSPLHVISIAHACKLH